MGYLLARKKPAASLGRMRSDSESGAPSSTTSSDQKASEEKRTTYRDARCEGLLTVKGSFMDASDISVGHKSKTIIQGLLEKAQPYQRARCFVRTCSTQPSVR